MLTSQLDAQPCALPWHLRGSVWFWALGGSANAAAHRALSFRPQLRLTRPAASSGSLSFCSSRTAASSRVPTATPDRLRIYESPAATVPRRAAPFAEREISLSPLGNCFRISSPQVLPDTKPASSDHQRSGPAIGDLAATSPLRPSICKRHPTPPSRPPAQFLNGTVQPHRHRTRAPGSACLGLRPATARPTPAAGTPTVPRNGATRAKCHLTVTPRC